MNKPIAAAAARAVLICAAVTVGYSAAAGGISNSQSAVNASPTYVVRFQDLDLSKIDGAMALYSRLRHAASVVCETFESRDMGLSAQHRACVDKAIGDAVASVNRPLVSQYHQSRTKGDKVGPVQLAKVNDVE
ncbi:MAG TPA: UrcA family protein [Steroidobacteraceae bacterium]|nr:UrcA family protein [Steroidobacteraceae bacterium]